MVMSRSARIARFSHVYAGRCHIWCDSLCQHSEEEAIKHYEVRTTIDASPEDVWAVLTDGTGFTTWDSGVTSFEGTIALGEKITLQSAANPGRSFPLKVEVMEPNRRMVWGGGMPLGLFRGERTYKLELENGSVTFTMREEFSGLLLGLIWRSMPDLQPSFDQFAAGLKARVESGETGGGQ